MLRRLRKANDPFMYTRGTTKNGRKLKVSRTRGRFTGPNPIPNLPPLNRPDLPPLTGR